MFFCASKLHCRNNAFRSRDCNNQNVVEQTGNPLRGGSTLLRHSTTHRGIDLAIIWWRIADFEPDAYDALFAFLACLLAYLRASRGSNVRAGSHSSEILGGLSGHWIERWALPFILSDPISDNIADTW